MPQRKGLKEQKEALTAKKEWYSQIGDLTEILCLQYFWLSKVIGCRRVAGGKCNSDVTTRAIDREEKKVRLIISPDGTPYPRHLNYF